MDIQVKGLLTADRLREVLALVEAAAGINCYFDGRLRIQSAAEAAADTTHKGVLVLSDAEDAGVNLDLENEEDRWDGPLPAYMGGVVDNSPEAIERQRLYELKMQSRALRDAEAAELKQRLSLEHNMSKELFGRLRMRYGQAFIDSINAEIAAVWAEVKPVFSVNCKDGKAGQPRLMPQLEVRGDSVSFHGFNLTGTTTRIATPVSMADKMLGARPIWKYKEWVEYAVPRIRAVIDEYAEKAQLVKVGATVCSRA